MARSLTRRTTEGTEEDARDPWEEEDHGGPARTKRQGSGLATRTRRRPADDADDEEEENTRRSKRRPARDTEARSTLGSGWDAYKANKAKASKFNRADQFKVEEKEEYLVAFLEDKPFATYNEHGTGEGKSYRAYVCLGEDCPLCELGDTPGYRAVFNVIVFDDKGNPEVKYWIATPGPLDEIEVHRDNDRYKPLNREGNYFAVSKKRKGHGPYNYKVERLTVNQVSEEFDIDPLSSEEISELAGESFAPKDVVRVKTRKELREIVEDIGE